MAYIRNRHHLSSFDDMLKRRLRNRRARWHLLHSLWRFQLFLHVDVVLYIFIPVNLTNVGVVLRAIPQVLLLLLFGDGFRGHFYRRLVVQYDLLHVVAHSTVEHARIHIITLFLTCLLLTSHGLCLLLNLTTLRVESIAFLSRCENCPNERFLLLLDHRSIDGPTCRVCMVRPGHLIFRARFLRCHCTGRRGFSFHILWRIQDDQAARMTL